MKETGLLIAAGVAGLAALAGVIYLATRPAPKPQIIVQQGPAGGAGAGGDAQWLVGAGSLINGLGSAAGNILDALDVTV